MAIKRVKATNRAVRSAAKDIARQTGSTIKQAAGTAASRISDT